MSTEAADTRRTWLSVDLLAFTEDADQSRLVLIRREGTPHQGALTLPGGLLDAGEGETVEDAARRIAREKIGVEITGGIASLGWVSDTGRDERGHTVSLMVATRVPAETPGAVLPEKVPIDMPFGHTGMVVKSLHLLDDRLFTDPSTTYALLGTRTTPSRAISLGTAISGDTRSAVRSRFLRGGLYLPTDATEPTKGRPERVYAVPGLRG